MLYGLIGYPLVHSFSRRYFTEKFEAQGILANYRLFELNDIRALPALLAGYPALRGLNVTIPYKERVIPYLTRLSATAQKVGAVNVIKIETDGTLTGHNTDVVGFSNTLLDFLPALHGMKAIVLGNGGAGKAVEAVLCELGVPYMTVARSGLIKFEDVTGSMVKAHQLIINTTPLGMYPELLACPFFPYASLSPEHFVYDLVYNPIETLFLQEAKAQGAHTHNGLAMLHAQAEESWRIWNVS